MVLIDGDMRRPSLHDKLGFRQSPGLADLLAEADDVRPMLMYGVPFPNGEVVRPISEQEAEEKINEIAEEKSEATE